MRKCPDFLQIMGLVFGLTLLAQVTPGFAAEPNPSSCPELIRKALPSSSETEPKRLVDELIPPHQLPLSPEIFAEIKAHPKLMKLAEQTQGGKGVRFFFPNVFDDKHRANPLKNGEAIQALMVEKILQGVFPLAEFPHFPSPEKGTFRAVPLQIYDLAEHGGVVDRNDLRYLHMLILKNGNPSPSFLNRQDIRNLFGFSADDRVVSYYFADGYYTRLTSHGVNRLKAWAKAGRVQLFFYSPNFTDAVADHEKMLRSQFKDVRLLSQLSVGELRALRARRGQAVVIINDLRGYKSNLDAASNVSIVEGPLNHAEALETGTPVISLIDRASLYETSSLDAALGNLKATRGLYRAKNPQDVARWLRKLLDQPPKKITPPHLVKADPAGTTLFRLVLGHLADYLERRLNEAKTVRRK